MSMRLKEVATLALCSSGRHVQSTMTTRYFGRVLCSPMLLLMLTWRIRLASTKPDCARTCLSACPATVYLKVTSALKLEVAVAMIGRTIRELNCAFRQHHQTLLVGFMSCWMPGPTLGVRYADLYDARCMHNAICDRCWATYTDRRTDPSKKVHSSVKILEWAYEIIRHRHVPGRYKVPMARGDEKDSTVSGIFGLVI
ncbi:hypothetical protein BDW74DRAFT_56158 [Aspergillus multicolor]|uniref:uncharacterized protein n=1 Tax=Aspergillus multicolor TaxID=41759 RepID=UPI003CCCB46B